MAIFIINIFGNDEDIVIFDSEEKKQDAAKKTDSLPTTQLEIVPFDQKQVKGRRNRAPLTN